MASPERVTTALPEIRRLPADLRDQIAAGEVVERPSSVVKELLENALDAGARTVRVEIEGGGLARIAVIDDGHGMTREGALLAIERHATSKIEKFDDLYRLVTFGFRGEALPSIASVSRFTIITRPHDALSAIDISVTAGSEPSVNEVGAPPGTAIEVKELFFNVPARRKFLKSVGTEAGHVSDVCLDVALARPDLALTLVRDRRTVRQYLRAATRAARATDVLAPELVHVEGERPRVRVEAFISPPERARSGATGLHLLVNGRAVRDRLLARAVAMAYGSVLDPGRYPTGVVYLDVPPEDVDVNVHPQKAEVRFARGRDLYNDVTRILGAVLSGALHAPASGASFLDSGVSTKLFPAEPSAELSAPQTAVGHAALDLSRAMATQRAGAFGPDTALPDTGDAWGLVSTEGEVAPPTKPPLGPSFRAESSPPVARPNAIGSTLVSPDATTAARLAEEARELRTERRYGTLKFLAQVRATYLVCEGDDALFVIDQHAAAERVNFARLRAAHAQRGVQRQQLLVPEIVTVGAGEAPLVDEARDEFLACGVDARAIGDGRVAVHGVPAMLVKATPATLLRDLLDELAKSGGRKFGDAVDLVLATMACHGSVRAGDVLHPDECAALLRSLDEVDFAGYCPHGRPIVTTLSYGELEKKVGRR